MILIFIILKLIYILNMNFYPVFDIKLEKERKNM